MPKQVYLAFLSARNQMQELEHASQDLNHWATFPAPNKQYLKLSSQFLCGQQLAEKQLTKTLPLKILRTASFLLPLNSSPNNSVPSLKQHLTNSSKIPMETKSHTPLIHAW